MNAFELRAQLSSGPVAKAYEAWSKQYHKDVLVKEYQRSNITTAENLLREAIRQAREKPAESASLCEVILAATTGQGTDSSFTVNFILEKREGTVARVVLTRNDDVTSGQPGLSAYQKQEKICKKPAGYSYTTKVCKGYAPQLQRDVVIKSIGMLGVEEANQYIKEAFLQAYVEHDRNCKLIDFCITKKPDRSDFKVHLVVECMVCDMQDEVDKRTRRQQPYTEEELLQILQDITAGLAHAKRFHIAHRDIKPANIFLEKNGRCKLGDFGSAWKKQWVETLTHSGAGTLSYVSLEMKNCMLDPDSHEVDPFIADIFSLGLTMLHFALLKYPIDIENVDAGKLSACLAGKVGEMRYSDEFKQLIGEMVAINPMIRPRLDNVVEKVKLLLLRTAAPAPRRQEESKQVNPTVQSSVQVPQRQLSIQKLARVTEDQVHLFNFQSNSWNAPISFNTPIKCDWGSTYVFVDESSICVCGNAFEQTGNGGEAYVVHLEGSVQELPNMGKRRWGAGLVVDNGEVLVFGGNDHGDQDHFFFFYREDRAHKSCISFNLSHPQAWTTQGNMSGPKWGFTPCVHSRKVYLCGRSVIDVFDLTARSFEPPLNVTLQEELFVDRVSFVDESELVVISRERTTRVNLSSLHTQQEQHENRVIAPNSSVVVAGGLVYWARPGTCVRATLRQPTRFEEF